MAILRSSHSRSWWTLLWRLFFFLLVLGLGGVFVLPLYLSNTARIRPTIEKYWNGYAAGKISMAKRVPVVFSTESPPFSVDRTPTVLREKTESKPALPGDTVELKPTETDNTMESKPTQSHNTVESKPTQSDKNMEKKPPEPSKKQESKPSQPVERVESKQNSNQNNSRGKRYLIYLCDDKNYCFGLGDRQRAILGMYALAEVTNRTYGVITTHPTNLTDFYKPNEVNWVIPQSELEGKSTREIDALGVKKNMFWDKINFNKLYPEDVIYIRTNQNAHNQLIMNPNYIHKFPKWAQHPRKEVFALGWMRLMTPTNELRQALNEELERIAQKIETERHVYGVLNNSNCCVDVNTTKLCNTTIQKAEGNNKTCTADNRSQLASKACVELLRQKSDSKAIMAQLEPFAVQFCEFPTPGLQPKVTMNDIKKLQGYDTVNLNLVCVHIRMSHSSTLPFEHHVRNAPESLTVVWNFLRPYIDNGYHFYLATDSEEVRKEGKALFGEKMHQSTEDIVHIAHVQEGQDKRKGFRLALMEQLLLATSCKVLVISKSGYSMRASSIRQRLMPDLKSTYMFINWRVNLINGNF